MKIENPLLAQVSTGAVQQSGSVTEVSKGGPQQSKLDGLLDEVQLSNLGSALRELSAKEAAQPPGTSARAAEITHFIQDGSYDIDTAALSKKIIEETTALS